MKKSDQDTVVIAIGDQEERVSRDRVELAPIPMDLAPINGLHQALQLLGGSGRDEGRSVVEDGDTPPVLKPSAADGEQVGNQMASAGAASELRASIRRTHVGEPEGLQRGDDDDVDARGRTEDTEYVIERLVDHAYQDGKLILKVRWYGCEDEDATWEPIDQLPRSTTVTYFRRKHLPLPAQGRERGTWIAVLKKECRGEPAKRSEV